MKICWPWNQFATDQNHGIFNFGKKNKWPIFGKICANLLYNFNHKRYYESSYEIKLWIEVGMKFQTPLF